MSKNTIKAPQPVAAPPRPKRKKGPSLVSRLMSKVMNMFGIIQRNQIVESMPFILFITALIIVYIANSYYAERMIREIDKTKVELKEKRAEYISVMSRHMYQSSQSEVARALQPFNIKESTEPPGKIFIAKNQE